MKMKTLLGKTVGKTAQFFLSKLGRGTTLPGRLALKFDPDILASLAKDYEVIVITGTNGKTLTTALTVGILEEAYGPVTTNTSGANMLTGITATFLSAKPNKNGKKIAVLEIDEASLSKVTRYIQPKLIVFTNIFRDQMDRYGEIYTTYQMIVDGAAQAPQATILANGDSPLFHSKELVNPVHYYGFNHQEGPLSLAHYNTEGILCPQCHHILHYKMNTYANLGNYYCPHCGFSRPELDYQVTDLLHIDHHSSQFRIDGQDYQINIGGLYNIYNALAAVSIASFMGIPAETIKAGFEKSKAVFGRQESFQLGDKNCTLILIKNPVGASQAIQLLGHVKEPFSLSVLLNANYADGIDTSWIWDADFEQIIHYPITAMQAGGVRASEMARRLRVTGYPEENIVEHSNLKDVLNWIEEQDSKEAYILATYTAMLQLRELLAQRQAVEKEMK